MAKLTSAERKKIPSSQMGVPGKATKQGGAVAGSYPMPDKAHARAAKSLVSRFGSPSEKAAVDAKADRILGKGKQKKGG